MTLPNLTVRPVDSANWLGVSSEFEDITYEQSATYGQAAAARIGAEVMFVALYSTEGKLVAAACLRFKHLPGIKRGIAWIASGPLVRKLGNPALSPEQLRAVFATLRDHCHAAGHILRLRLSAVTGFAPETIDGLITLEGYQPTDRSVSYRSVIIDLEQEEDALMRALHGKWRNPLRNALKSGLSLEQGSLAEFSERFHQLYEDVRRAKGFSPDIPPEFYYTLSGSGFTQEALIAREGGQDVGGMTIGITGPNAVYLFGATTAAGRHLNAGHFLMWKAMLHCRARGMRRFDLGGIDEADNPSVARFKLRTGGADVTAPGPYESSPDGLIPKLILGAEALYKKW
ncbi:peptidoglycan bridge formation glycyltransferase FemA/FemB family protein [Pseudohalocynthiibacter sp. F2068]|uniref:lipid II:glycine glycyltransferase FemX n=1 Tax=Pseudohalocynthiibacter sp. F2068 TaxID=2926418 RepID=UPI001FF4862A|nr:peptidoglycan bridge formation glycyltransferase FemA/FemB family protein [Pseudohalocynthiibacter sp. F2068]MCK0103898.1 peptidoglycan bridge formation glycyltransferase FemA/FemB family protein [Pseudohalocynthiibacter sp. F2068]